MLLTVDELIALRQAIAWKKADLSTISRDYPGGIVAERDRQIRNLESASKKLEAELKDQIYERDRLPFS